MSKNFIETDVKTFNEDMSGLLNQNCDMYKFFHQMYNLTVSLDVEESTDTMMVIGTEVWKISYDVQYFGLSTKGESAIMRKELEFINTLEENIDQLYIMFRKIAKV